MTFLIITHELGVEKSRKISQKKEENFPFNLSLYSSQSNVRVNRKDFFQMKNAQEILKLAMRLMISKSPGGRHAHLSIAVDTLDAISQYIKATG